MSVPALFDLTGRVALVTGGSKGLGFAMARSLAEAGADIVISSRHEDDLRKALEQILVLPWSEKYEQQHLDYLAFAVRECAELLRK